MKVAVQKLGENASAIFYNFSVLIFSKEQICFFHFPVKNYYKFGFFHVKAGSFSLNLKDNG